MKQKPMKIIIFSALIFTLLVLACDTNNNPIINSNHTNQKVWKLQNITPTSNDLLKFFWIDDFNGFAVGKNGTLIHTADGGTTWETQYTGTNDNLQSIYFMTNNIGIIIGERGTILKTKNGGLSWKTITNNSLDYNPYHYDVYFWNENDGFIAGSPTLKTQNGGESWHTTVGGYPNQNHGKVTFIDKNIGYAINWFDHWLYKTTDGGDNWNYVKNFSAKIYDIMFLDDKIGYINNVTGVLKTIDGGITWDTLSMGAISGGHSNDLYYSHNSIYFSDTLNGIIANGHNNLYITSDGGFTWEEQIITTKDAFIEMTDAYITSSGKYIAIGAYGTILTKENKNAEWVSYSNFKNEPWLYDVATLSEFDAIVVGNLGTILRTSNGGDSWETILIDSSYYLRSVSFVDQNNGITVGYNVVLKTTDGGFNWTKILDHSNTMFTEVQYIDDTTIVILGSLYDKILLKSIDGGNNWIEISLNSISTQNSSLNSFQFIDSDTAFLLIENVLHKSFDGGISWTSQEIPDVNRWRLSHLSFINSNVGYVFGNGGLVFKTLDGGDTWADVSIDEGMFGGFMTVEFIDSLNGVVTNWNSRVFTTSNGGNSWIENNHITHQWLQGSSFYNENIGYLVGVGGTILKTE